MGQSTDQITVAGDRRLSAGLVHGCRAAGFGEEKAFGALALPIPFVLAGKCPNGVSRRLGRAVFRHHRAAIWARISAVMALACSLLSRKASRKRCRGDDAAMRSSPRSSPMTAIAVEG